MPEPAFGAEGDPTQVYPTSWEPTLPFERGRDLEANAAPPRTSFGGAEEESVDAVAVPRPSMVEQAVPWLIGVILLLAGIVIVLIALIFAGDASFGGTAANPSGALPGLFSGSAQPSGALPGLFSGSAEPSASAAATARPTQTVAVAVATPRPTPTPVPVPAPEYGALEVVYQGRSTALAPIYLLRHDFTTEEAPAVLARDPGIDVRRFAWAPDGTVGVALLADILVSVEPGVQKRRLGDGISTATFGDDETTVYAVRIEQADTNDTASVFAVDFVSGGITDLAAVTYARPQIAPETALQEAQFADEGGTVRLVWLEDGRLRLWILGAGAWDIDPATGDIAEVGEEILVVWAPDGERRIVTTESDTQTTLELVDEDNEVLDATTVSVLVSHIRWSPDGQRVMFTGGRLASGGGVLQDLYLWDPDPDQEIEPQQITSTGAAFGVEWLGTQTLWRAVP